MVLDSWKRLYSNTPGAKFREIAVNGLWAGADIPNSPTQEVGHALLSLHCSAQTVVTNAALSTNVSF